MQTVEIHGETIPALGFGTFQLEPEVAEARVRDALQQGCRLIDTARMYQNEEGVGRGLAAADVPRDRIFLTTKLWRDEFAPDDVARCARESLERLGVDHLDLLLLHWPNPDIPLEDTLGALDDLRREGLIRHYGVSNFPTDLFARAVEASPAPLLTNQVECHPFIDQRRVHAAVRDADAALTAYCPIAQGQVLDEPLLQDLGAEHDATPAQIALAWHLAKGDVVAIPRSSRKERVRENLDAAQVTLTADELTAIDGLRERHQRLIEPGFAPDWDAPGPAGG